MLVRLTIVAGFSGEPKGLTGREKDQEEEEQQHNTNVHAGVSGAHLEGDVTEDKRDLNGPMTPALSSRMSDNSVNARTAFEPEDPVQLARAQNLRDEVETSQGCVSALRPPPLPLRLCLQRCLFLLWHVTVLH